MQQLPNEGLLSLEDIRDMEFGEKLFSNQDFELVYDPNFRLTDVRDVTKLPFAFTMKTPAQEAHTQG